MNFFINQTLIFLGIQACRVIDQDSIGVAGTSTKDQQRNERLRACLLAVYGVWQRDAETDGEVRHLIAGHLKDLTPLLGGLVTQSRDFH